MDHAIETPIIRYQMVPIDGLLADVVTPYTAIATTLLQRIIEIDPLLDPPHTLARLGIAAGLTPNQSARVIKAICAIRDFWTRLGPLPGLEAWRFPPPGIVPIFYAVREQTVGETPLFQTLDWAQWNGLKSPILCVVTAPDSSKPVSSQRN